MASITTYNVTGMGCRHCVNAVTASLSSLAGVFAVSIDLTPDGASRVTVASDGPLPQEAVSVALDAAGGYQISAG